MLDYLVVGESVDARDASRGNRLALHVTVLLSIEDVFCFCFQRKTYLPCVKKLSAAWGHRTAQLYMHFANDCLVINDTLTGKCSSSCPLT